MENKPNKIIIHHDGVDRTGDSFDVINAYHKQKFGMLSKLGFYVGYHYIIEKTGAIRQSREHDEEGAHTKGQNSQSIGIMLAGNFDVAVPTLAQVESLGVLLASLIKSENISANEIHYHREYAPKSCPGARIKDGWATAVYWYYIYKYIVNQFD